jgi:predicted ester cyclase
MEQGSGSMPGSSTRASPARRPAGRGGTVRQVDHNDLSVVMAPGQARRQDLGGFAPGYADIVDYIIRSTHRIWEERGVGLIYSHYKHDCVVQTPLSVSRSREEVVAATLRTLAGFPDRRSLGNEVIWSGNAAEGFYTSHRVTSISRNSGWSDFGPPTGKRVTWRTVADCMVYENRVCQEWVVRDHMAAVQQMGLDPRAVAQRIAAQKIARGETLADFGEVDRTLGQNPPPESFTAAGANDPAERLVCQALHDIWNRRRFDAMRGAYAPNVTVHVPPLRDLKGINAYAGYVIALLAMMSNAGLLIHHVCSVPEGSDGRKVAVRWTLDGHHDGPGRLGDPTGKRLSLMGMSHCHVRRGRIVEEWTMFDELSLLVQLEMPTQ